MKNKIQIISNRLSKNNIIKTLGLEPHPLEGGYFKRTYESNINIDSERKLLTSIYYMLTSDNPISSLHKNKSDIIHYYHLGSPLKYMLISPNGILNEHVLGPNLLKGEKLQLLVKGGDWKVAKLCSGEYSLISEAVAPGFEYKDNEISTPEQLKLFFPSLEDKINKFYGN